MVNENPMILDGGVKSNLFGRNVRNIEYITF